jgi:hypothetical protein
VPSAPNTPGTGWAGNDGGNDGADEGGTGTQSDTRTAYADPETAPDLRTHPSFDFPQDLLARIRPHILVTVPVLSLMGITRIRDGLCRFPGCTRAATHTEIDHTGQWQGHGATQYDNLACLCAKHHHLKDQTIWKLRQRDHGILEWTAPTGRHYTTEPEIDLPTPPTRPERRGTGGDRRPPARGDDAPPF